LAPLHGPRYIEANEEEKLLGRWLLILLLMWSGLASAAEITDATGRTVQVPDHIARVLPAGPPAAVLLEAIAPDLMVGWPEPVSDNARALLPSDVARLPQIPRLTGHQDVTAKLQALKPDLIIDYGTVSPQYADLVRTTQEKTGIPTILLDGSLSAIPHTMRMVGRLLHRDDRADTIAAFAEALLALRGASMMHPRVLYARGADGLTVAAPGTDVTEVFTHLGWQVLAPDGQGTFRASSIDAIRDLDPDILIFADPAMHDTVTRNAAWRSVRAVREGHVFVAPNLPFGWIEEPPSINRLLGLAWLEGRDPLTLAALFNAVVYGRALTPMQLGALLAGVHTPQP
jgi:iron complex transport system substrate-binding protein